MESERERLERVAAWYSSKDGFYARLVHYGFATLQPFFVGSTCLELGPADGQMTGMLLRAFATVTSVDGSASFCAQLQAEYEGVSRLSVTCSLFEEYEPTHRYDTIIATHILEHLDDPVTILKRVSRWLAPEGRLILLVPNANSFHRLVAVKMGLLQFPDQLNDLDISLGHRRVYTRALLDEHLALAGWSISAAGGVFFKALTNRQTGEWFSEQMMDGFYELGKDFPEHAAEIYAICRPAAG